MRAQLPVPGQIGGRFPRPAGGERDRPPSRGAIAHVPVPERSRALPMRAFDAERFHDHACARQRPIKAWRMHGPKILADVHAEDEARYIFCLKISPAPNGAS